MLLTDSEDDFVEMDAKTNISNADAKKSFSVCIQWAEENNIDMQDFLLLKRLEQKAQIKHLNKISQHKFKCSPPTILIYKNTIKRSVF